MASLSFDIYIFWNFFHCLNTQDYKTFRNSLCGVVRCDNGRSPNKYICQTFFKENFNNLYDLPLAKAVQAFTIHTMRGIPWTAEDLLACEK